MPEVLQWKEKPQKWQGDGELEFLSKRGKGDEDHASSMQGQGPGKGEVSHHQWQE